MHTFWGQITCKWSRVQLHPPFTDKITDNWTGFIFAAVGSGIYRQKQHTKLEGLGSRAGVDGVGDPLVGRTSARRVELDAEVLVGAAGVVATQEEEEKKTHDCQRIQAERYMLLQQC